MSTTNPRKACHVPQRATPHPPACPDEVDIDVDPDDVPATRLEVSEYLGDFVSIEAYLRAMLEPEIAPGVAWLLDCLDMGRVLARFESDGSRLRIEQLSAAVMGGVPAPRSAPGKRLNRNSIITPCQTDAKSLLSRFQPANPL